MECSICLSNVKIPIILECFECFSPYKYNCMTTNRTCFACFLDLKKNKNNCFICRSKVVDYNKFRIDLEFIYNDKEKDCFQCKFCENNFNNHKDLYKHCFLDNQCIYKCLCNEFIIKNDEIKHKSKCSKFIFCNFCKKFHIKEKCCKNSNEFFCEIFPNKCLHCCEIVINPNHWKNECIFRKIQCPNCKEIFIADNIMEHFIGHLKKSKMKQELLNEILKKEQNEYLKNIEDLPKLYYEVFNEVYSDNDNFFS